MAGRCGSMYVLLVFFLGLLQPSASSLTKVSAETNKSTGVFLLIDGGNYTFNYTEATDACLFLNVTIATKAQIEEAVQHGLETCKFGWVAEKIAVIPRIKSDNNCGKGRTGMVSWKAPVYKKFAVFCFNASELVDQNQTWKPTTASPQSTRSSTSLEALTEAQSPASAVPTFGSSPRPPPAAEEPATSHPPKQAASTIPTTTTDLSFSSSPVKHPPRVVTSTPTGVTFRFSSSTYFTSSSASSQPGLHPSVSSSIPLLEVYKISLISLSIVLLLVSAATVWWCYKSNFVRWYIRRHTNNIDTEMWKNIHSGTDLCSENGAETEHDEEQSTKYSSDIMLCENPRTQTNSSE